MSYPWTLTLALAALAIGASALLYAAHADAKTMEIPNRVHPLLLAAGVLRLAAAGFAAPSLISAAVGLLLGGLPLLILALFRSVGGGDIKLVASAGFALGWWASYLSLMLGLTVFIVRRRPKDNSRLAPFAPCYAAAALAGLTAVTILTIWR